ncbi:hypothetical protein HMPREF9163_01713 [Selenomonas sp. oral taxon 138 str. F0429]|nr:hypothetical protein HMPREF9163_01713 [Selenomonas sp. oral taxon 138 str. F0429]
MKHGNPSFVPSVTTMYAKESIMASIPCSKHVQILTDIWDYRNTAFVKGHSNNEFISDDILHTARVAGGFLLVVFKEYFQPLSNG